ncbi:MAG TPA: DUF5317 family protein [Mycobacteriales bacterium]|nr:DUF5317 family protein [Mycobacteriales bacterium]
MLLLLASVLGGVVVGRLRGGTFARLGELHPHRWSLVLLAVGAQLVGVLAGGTAASYTGFLVAALLAAGFVLANRGVPGLGLILAGLLCNLVVITANSGVMPVKVTQLARVGKSTGALLHDPLHAPEDSTTSLAFLDDWIPVVSPLPWGSAVASPGDVLVASGVALFVTDGVALGAKARRRRR